MARSVTLQNYVAARLALADKFQATLLAGARLAGERARAYLVDQTDKTGKVDRGGFKRGWKSRAEDGHQVKLTLWNQQPYAAVVEYGRRPGRRPPPSQVIEKWLERRVGLDRKEAMKRAWIVARSIGKKGFAGVHILEGSFKRVEQLIIEEVQAKLDAAMRL